MKVYFLGIFYKTSTLEEAKLLKTACDIWPLTIGDWGPEYDLMEFIGKVLTEKTSSGNRRTVTEDNYDCHCFVRDDNLAGVFIADKIYPTVDAYVAVERMLDDFMKQYSPATWKDLSDDKVEFPLNDYLQAFQQTTTTLTMNIVRQDDIKKEEFEPLVEGNLDYSTCLQNLRNTVQYRQKVSLNRPTAYSTSSKLDADNPLMFDEKGACSGCVIA